MCVCMHKHTHILPSSVNLSAERALEKGPPPLPKGMNISSTQTLDFVIPSSNKGSQSFLENCNWIIRALGQKKYKMNLEYPMPESKKCSKMTQTCQKDNRAKCTSMMDEL